LPRIPTEGFDLGRLALLVQLDNGVPFALGAMMDLLQPSQGGIPLFPTRERRVFSRHSFQRKAICQPQAGPHDDIWLLGTAQDISLAGIGFVLHRRFDPGTLLTVELEKPKRDSWGTLQARVMHSAPQPDGNWKLGCALVPNLSESELKIWLNGKT
jgi:hypothetical protein